MTNNKILFSSILANSLEFYDFTLFSIFLPILTPIFFHDSLSDRTFIIGWVIFAAGFIMRPVGAIIFGHFGDKLGRKKVLSLSILLMAIPTFIIGMLPSYSIIGIWAFLILIFCRLLQGLCTGAEHNGAAIFSLEHLNKVGAGMAGGLISGSCFVGAIAANFMGYLYTSRVLSEEGWRIAFILGGILSLIIYRLRSNINETPEFEVIKNNKQITKVPLLDALKNHKLSCFVTFMVALIDGSLCYTLLVFLNIYLPHIHNICLSEVMELNTVGLISAILFTPIAGWYSDKIGTFPLMLSATAASAIFILPIFFLFNLFNYPCIFFAELMLGLLIAGILGPQHSFFQTLFPPEVRYSGIGVLYCLGISLGGATIPLILNYLMKMQGNANLVFLSIPFIVYGAITSVCIYRKHYSNIKYFKYSRITS